MRPECMAPPRTARPQPGGESGRICAGFGELHQEWMPSAPPRGRRLAKAPIQEPQSMPIKACPETQHRASGNAPPASGRSSPRVQPGRASPRRQPTLHAVPSLRPQARPRPGESRHAHDRTDVLPDPFGRGLDVAIPQMGVAKRRAHIGMAEQPGHDRYRHTAHHRLARMRMTQVVQPAVLDVRLAANAVPEPQLAVTRPPGGRGTKETRRRCRLSAAVRECVWPER